MKNKQIRRESSVMPFENLIFRLEQIRGEFYRQIPDSDEIDQDTFENAINEAQTEIGSCMVQQLVDRCRREKGGRAL